MKWIRTLVILWISLFFYKMSSSQSIMGKNSDVKEDSSPIKGHWDIFPANNQESFRSIYVLNHKDIWASGTHGTVLESHDGGKNWHTLQVPGAENLDFRGIWVLNSKIIMVMSSGESLKGQSRIYRTINGGQKWDLVYNALQTGIFLDAIQFWDQKKGLILGDPVKGKFFILFTGDSGRHWDTVNRFKMPTAGPDEGAFAASNTSLSLFKNGMAWFGTGGTSGGRIFTSSNYGLDWKVSTTSIKKGVSAGVFSLYFLNSQTGWGAGGDYKKLKDTLHNFIQTQDGGRNWGEGKPIVSGYMECLKGLPNGQLLAIGPNGTSLYSSKSKKWMLIDSLPFHALSQYKKSLWAVGPKGLIAKWVQ